MKCSVVQCSVVQCSAVQCSAVQCSLLLYLFRSMHPVRFLLHWAQAHVRLKPFGRRCRSVCELRCLLAAFDTKQQQQQHIHHHDYHEQQLHQGLFCHNQVSLGKILDFFNLWRNLLMFLDTMEPRTENKSSSLEKTVLITWAQIYWIIALIVHKMTLKKIICKIGTSRG